MHRNWVVLAAFAFVVVSTGSAQAGGGYSAAIVLTKTVGTDPTCGTTDTIEVPAGTQVTYCYTVGNPSNATFLTHTLEDDQLGILFGPNQVQPLPPGQEIEVLVQAQINVDTVNTATWTASISPTAGWSAWTRAATDMATVTVLEMGPAGCSDGIDNDGDGLADCTDPQCEGEAVCVAPAPALSTGALVFSALLLLGIGGLGLTARRRA